MLIICINFFQVILEEKHKKVKKLMNPMIFHIDLLYEVKVEIKSQAWEIYGYYRNKYNIYI